MRVEQLFVETLIDIRQKLNSNPTEYHLLKVSSLLRQILLENLLEDASTATSPCILSEAPTICFCGVRAKNWQYRKEGPLGIVSP